MIASFQKFVDNYIFVKEVSGSEHLLVFCKLLCTLNIVSHLPTLLPLPCAILPPILWVKKTGFERFGCLPNVPLLVKWQHWNVYRGPSDLRLNMIVLFKKIFLFLSFLHLAVSFGVLFYFPLALPLFCPQALITSDLAWDKCHNWSPVFSWLIFLRTSVKLVFFWCGWPSMLPFSSSFHLGFVS